MKSPQVALVILCVLLSRPTVAQQSALPAADRPGTSSVVAVQEESPAQQRIAAAQLQIKADPKKVQAYNELAICLVRRARETADTSYLKDADAALAEGLKLDSTDFQLQKTQVALMLSRRQFAQARERATALHQRTPDDAMTYGYLAEANMALGNYQQAETNAQWMMNLRPNNTPALLVGATLRTIFGDAHGAIDFLNRASAQTSPTEVEELAWIANQIASIQIDTGELDAAERTLQEAEQIFPRYPYTMETLARVRTGENRANEAIQLWMQVSRIDRDPHLLYELARAQQAVGRESEARITLAEFKDLASAPETATDSAKLDLILTYAETPATAPDALALAQKEITARQDVWALDAYAWALYANGEYQSADAAEQKAIAVGIQSAQIFDHAGHIAQRLNRASDAVKYFQLSIQTNPSSEFSADARRSLGLDADAENDEQKPSQFEPARTAEQPSPLEPALIVADQSGQRDQSAASLSGAIESGAPNFAAVPDDLLTPQPTETNHLIHTAQASVAHNPKDAQGYAGLGAAYFQHARETGDVSDYLLAEESLNTSLDLVSVDFSADAALGTMAEVCMGEHRFADALGYAQKALSLGTGDVSPFAIVGDAYADMGEYERASVAYGRLTPRDTALSPRVAYARDSRLSYLKFIAGDTRAAIGLMKIAVTEGVEAQLPSENLAWLYYELGEYETQAGDAASADAAYLASLKTHPGDYRALAALARLRANNGRFAEAISLYQKAIAVVPMPTFVAELGDLYEKTGNQTEARKQYALVEYIGLLGHINQVLHNRDLALFYADHDMKLAESLALAQKELEVRRDVYTWDALAWALYKNGKLADAAEASKNATRFGTRDSLLLFHAAMIADGLDQREQARNELTEALHINPHFHLIYSDAAQQKLLALEPHSASNGGSNARLR
jgi:tetratricopeptide (TPR) repeat protein